MLAALISVCIAGAQAPAGGSLTPTNATVQVSTISQTDPHPTTYNWEGEVPVVKEPGANYYAFYYTGTVGPDARVPDGTPIMRIPVKLNDWSSNKRWIIAQLTMYYQQAHNLPATALQEYQAGPLAAAPGAPGAQAAPQPGQQPGQQPGAGGGLPGAPAPGFGAPTAQPQAQPQQPQGEPEEAQNDEMREDEEAMGPSGPGGGVGGPIAAAFDPKGAAEWTFYYDQFVLWQYYCARTLLNNQDLIEQLPPSQRTQTQLLVTQISGITPQSLRAGTLSQSQRQAQMAQLGPQGRAQMAGDMAQFNSQYMNQSDVDFMTGQGGAPGGMGMGMGGGTLVEAQQITLLREKFEPLRDFAAQATGSKTKAEEYREKFQNAAKQLDEQVYTQFMEMLKGIDQRQVGNENYEKWMKGKRQEVSTYADTWRKLEHGETMMINDTMFIVSKEKLESVPNETINIVKRERLTPADLLNPDGTVRQPENK